MAFTQIFCHGPAYRLSVIGPIVIISRLSFVTVYSTICTKSIVIAYKICYKQQLYFGISAGGASVPGVLICQLS